MLVQLIYCITREGDAVIIKCVLRSAPRRPHVTLPAAYLIIIFVIGEVSRPGIFHPHQSARRRHQRRRSLDRAAGRLCNAASRVRRDHLNSGSKCARRSFCLGRYILNRPSSPEEDRLASLMQLRAPPQVAQADAQPPVRSAVLPYLRCVSTEASGRRQTVKASRTRRLRRYICHGRRMPPESLATFRHRSKYCPIILDSESRTTRPCWSRCSRCI